MRIRLNNVDHYQAAPSGFDPQLFGPHGSTQQRNAPLVPVIRVFGSTETGQKLRASIDHALATSYRRNVYDGKAIFVGHISLVKGIPFFGYHVGYRFYLKIYMLNPLNMTRFADLLHSGTIMKQVFQPFESHLQYLLQWMCDFNLYGCTYIECDVVKFRDPVPDYLEMESTKHLWHDRSIAPDLISNAADFPRQSHCSIEVDIRVEDILNRKDIHSRDLHHDFVERFKPLAPEEKLVQSLAGLWRDETKRRKLRMGLTDPSSSPFPPEVLVSMSVDARDTSKGGWIHEEEFRSMIDSLVGQEKPNAGAEKPKFEDFVRLQDGEVGIQTVLESVGDLFSASLQTSFAGSPPPPVDIHTSDGVRDDSDWEKALMHDDNDFPYASDDDEVAKALAATQLRLSKKAESATVQSSPRRSQQASTRPLSWTEQRKNGVQSAQRGTVDTSVSTDVVGKAFVETHLPLSSDEQASKLAQDKLDSSQPRKRRRLSTENANSALHSPNSRRVRFDADEISVSQSSQSRSATDHVEPKPSEAKSSGGSTEISPNKQPQANHEISPPPQIVRLATNFAQSSASAPMNRTLIFSRAAPKYEEFGQSLIDMDIPPVVYQDAFYSDEADVPERPRDYAGREFKLESATLPYLPEFDETGTSPATYGAKPPVIVDPLKEDRECARRQRLCSLRHWEFLDRPPRRVDIQRWLDLEEEARSTTAAAFTATRPKPARVVRNDLSQIDGPTQKNKHGFKFSQKQQNTSVRHETQYMSTMSLEVHVNSRRDLAPDPEQDEVNCIFWCIKLDDDEAEAHGEKEGVHGGILLLSPEGGLAKRISSTVSFEVQEENNELDLINRMIDIVRSYDPDILTGYEVHNGSWGYLIERSRIKYEYNLCDEFSRMKSQSHGRFGKDADRWGFNNTSTIRVTGRHMINIWRAMRSELNLLQYTMENVVFHLLHKRIPHHSFQDLTKWYQSGLPHDLDKVIQYFVNRVQVDLEILDANELIPRTSEQARLIGVDFFSVFSRGSQFKVESFMFRIAKPENFVLVSPSRKQVGHQNALECIPLVMEPQSAFYTSPVLVLDFQSFTQAS
ncbi:hypothetical protein MRB53_042040 [Persea americana]|nr:hypothetical protein MRB53_042040 [Persea americana]